MTSKSSGRPESPTDPSSQALVDLLLTSTLLEAVPDAIVAVEQDGTIVQVNSQTETLFGYQRGELLGQKIITTLDTVAETTLADGDFAIPTDYQELRANSQPQSSPQSSP